MAVSIIMLALMHAASGIQVSTTGGGSASTKIDASKDASVQVRISTHMPLSACSWYQGYGVYTRNGVVPISKNEFDF